MVGVAGFEPAHGGIKSRCLTTWRHPNIGCFIRQRRGLISNLLERSKRQLQLISEQAFHPAMLVFDKAALNVDQLHPQFFGQLAGPPLPIVNSPLSDRTVPTAVTTAAVPQAKVSLNLPLAASSRH